VGKIAKGLMKMAGDNGEGLADLALDSFEDSSTSPKLESPANGQSMSPWLETEECTSCDECIQLNSKIFAYNNDKKAFIKDPEAGPYSDLVKAAEKCTAGVIHPGLPKNKSEKDIEKWVARGEKFN
jgi:pyruvate-ferredoxin/flavodoxin oxidoreductase